MQLCRGSVADLSLIDPHWIMASRGGADRARPPLVALFLTSGEPRVTLLRDPRNATALDRRPCRRPACTAALTVAFQTAELGAMASRRRSELGFLRGPRRSTSDGRAREPIDYRLLRSPRGVMAPHSRDPV